MRPGGSTWSTWPGWCSNVREPPDRREEIDLVVAQAVLIAAAIAVTGPALRVAVPLAMAIDRRGWRRWPVLLAGAAVTTGAVAAGAWNTYLATIAEIWRAAARALRSRGHTPSDSLR